MRGDVEELMEIEEESKFVHDWMSRLLSGLLSLCFDLTVTMLFVSEGSLYQSILYFHNLLLPPA